MTELELKSPLIFQLYSKAFFSNKRFFSFKSFTFYSINFFFIFQVFGSIIEYKSFFMYESQLYTNNKYKIANSI